MKSHTEACIVYLLAAIAFTAAGVLYLLQRCR
jgi:hypothetical protein